MKSKKIVVVGAGTAGSATAIRLKQLGHDVFLIERNESQVFKIGESIPGATLRLLNTLGFRQMEEVLPFQYFRKTPAIASAWGSDEWFYKDSFNNPEGGGWQVSRPHFDKALRSRAIDLGVQFSMARVEKIEKQDSYFQLEIKDAVQKTQLLTEVDAVVDATGRSAMLLRKFGIKHQRFQTQMAVFGWFQAMEEVKEISLLKTTSNGWWYTALLPKQIRVVVFHSLPEVVARYYHEPELFFKAFNTANILATTITAANQLTDLYTCDASFSMAEQFSGDNWIAIGDAALSFDPISSQGIFFALYSAIRGAEALSANTPVALENYTQQIHQIAKQNHALRMQYYTSELRYSQEPYWKQYFEFSKSSIYK